MSGGDAGLPAGVVLSARLALGGDGIGLTVAGASGRTTAGPPTASI